MAGIGHHLGGHGQSCFRVYAPLKERVAVVLLEPGRVVPLGRQEHGYWAAQVPALPAGTRYWIEADGERWPDPASRRQPDGVHGASQVAAPEPVDNTGWTGVRIADAVIYELHLGSFTPEGNLGAAAGKLGHLAALGVNVVELMPLAAFPGRHNWGYDGTYPFALHATYGDYTDLRRFIESAHCLGIAVVLDVVYNHFGPEGNYAQNLAPYTRNADTPWGAAVNFDGPYSHGVRQFFLENLRYWLQDAGFDGLRMDAVSLVFDQMPTHILRQCNDLARQLARAEGREILMIAEHLRNDRRVTSPAGYDYHAQWNDDLNHAVSAWLTGESTRHYANFGRFEDIVQALERGFVLDGTRFDRHHKVFLGTDGRDTQGHEHVVHIQNHDQVGNRPLADRLIASQGRDKALLAITAVMASPYVPMLFMGEEYGETAPFPFFEDFADAGVIAGVRAGRRAEFGFSGVEPPDPHDDTTFLAAKLNWDRLETRESQEILAYYRTLVALKRDGRLGPRDRTRVQIDADTASEVIRIRTADTLTVLNFSAKPRPNPIPPGWQLLLSSRPDTAPGAIKDHAAMLYLRVVK